MAIRGRAEGDRVRLIAAAHQGEALARQKRLRPLDHYLDAKPSKRADGNAVAAAMKKLERAGARVRVKRLAPPPAAHDSDRKG